MRKIAKLVKRKDLPENPRKGSEYDIIVNNKKIGKRRVTLKATGKKGFGKWKFTQNNPILTKGHQIEFLYKGKKEKGFIIDVVKPFEKGKYGKPHYKIGTHKGIIHIEKSSLKLYKNKDLSII